MHPALLAFATKLQKETLPGIWARGLQLSREGSVHCDRWLGTPEEENLEITLRVRAADRPVAYQVNLWPLEEDAHCNCLGKVDPCEHIVASILAVKAGLRPASSSLDPSKSAGLTNRANTSVVPVLFLQDHELILRRVLQVPGKDPQPLTTSLTSLVGAIQSGRLAIPPVLATPADYRLDAFFSPQPAECSLNRLNQEGRRQLFKVLSEISTLVLENKAQSEKQNSTQIPLRITASQALFYIIVIDDQIQGQSFSARLKPQEAAPDPGASTSQTLVLGGLFGLITSSLSGEPTSAALFLIEPAGAKNSAPLGSGASSGLTRQDELLLQELQAAPSPVIFSLEDAIQDWVPRLDRWSRMLGAPIRVEMLSTHFPKWVDAPICLTVEVHDLDVGDWSIRAQLHYIEALPPPGTWKESASLATLSPDFSMKPGKRLPRRNLQLEQAGARRLHEKLGLRLGQSIRVSRETQWEWRKKILSFLEGSPPPSLLLGSAQNAILNVRTLQAKLKLRGETFNDLEGSLSFEVEPTSGGIHSRVDPSAVINAWREGQPWVRLLDGGFATLPQEWLNRFGAQISRILAKKASKEGLASLSKQSSLPLCGDPFGLLELAATDQMALEQGGLQFSKSIRALLEQDLESSPSEVPFATQMPGLASRVRPTLVLRDYQKVGIQWLQARAAQGLGAVLGDDMGLGKTLQALLAAKGRILVVCPASVLSAWRQQVEAFTTDKVMSYTGPERASLLQQLSDPQQSSSPTQVVLTTYGILRQDHLMLRQLTWDSIILDEAQTIKNPNSQISLIAHQLRAQFKVALTGTPIENHLGDLWSIYRYALPELLGERADFTKNWEDPIAHGKIDALWSLRRRIRPFFLRRLKSEVAQELPEKQEVTLQCELSEAEMSYYQAILLSSRQQIIEQLQSRDDIASSAPGSASGAAVLRALELLLRLRQASCHPALTPSPPPGFGLGSHSSKTQVLMESLKEATEAGHRSLVFSQWTSFLDLLQNLLIQEGISFDRLDGTTRDREGVVKRFQDPKGPSVLLLSLKAGGTGLTLTAADHVYLMDPWWNPSVEAQAADRAHRIGQARKVLIHRLVAQGTVEERISLLQGHKKSLAEALLSTDDKSVASASGAAPRPLREDLLELLQSL